MANLAQNFATLSHRASIDSIYSGSLPSTGEAYTIRWATPSDISDILRLQDLISDDEMIVRDAFYFQAALKQNGQILIARTSAGKMIASATMHTTMEDKHDEHNATITHSTLGSVMTHPDYRGNGLMGQLIDQWMYAQSSIGTVRLHARVRTHNDRSLKNFLRKDFNVIATGPSPQAPAHTVHFMHRVLAP